MESISKIEDMKSSFIDYVIDACCKENPNENHLSLLRLCAVFNSLKGKKPKMIIFTTNYDNLLERAYIGDEGWYILPTDTESLIDIFSDMRTREFKKFIKPRIKNSNKNEIKEEAENVALEIKNRVLMPSFYLDKERVKDCPYNKIPIIPIHGCIRICKCPECEKILYTEAAAIGKKRCVYCGSEISNVIVPTTEGETDKAILRLLEEYMGKAGTVIFIGYGFGDPHIVDRLKHGIEKSKIRTIVNFSLDPINHKEIDLGKIQVHDLKTEISTSLNQLIDMLKSDVDEIGEYIITYGDIYGGIYEDIPD
jgi:NAD-dependent SIR2 family protein deacetylase